MSIIEKNMSKIVWIKKMDIETEKVIELVFPDGIPGKINISR